MNLNFKHLNALAEIAIRAARKAGKHISETRPINVQHKEGGDTLASQVVTEVDQQAQDIILETLEPTFAQFDLALLTEESADDESRLAKDYFWCIDPIDGTLPFIESVPGYAVSIALVSRSGMPQVGVVYDPVEHTLYHAITGQGAFRDSMPWNLPEAGSKVRIITDRSVAAYPYCGKVATALNASVKGQGGAVMNAIWCLENPPACYFKFPKPEKGGGCFWDYAATVCIYNELGAIATDMSGKPMSLNLPESIYMNPFGILYATDSKLAQKIIALKETLS
ncbi:3'(2'),5'-bisphosphate nucleotidase CysQ family protein [Pontiella sulfatireligans]|uniref:Inositol-1-monophosphatase n=1 Tax=Pontiella sulfatireligans TaxID=2750658 RepID=A0A6C2UQS3_9BACT|nr:inositol monophosphatase [Pontiella sulfatireligans]VGO22293.1 Inositol-1-monophosphatase [Pontiella sulfatireligans]